MFFKKTLLSTVLFTLSVAAFAQTQTEGWGAVTGNSEVGAWGAAAESIPASSPAPVAQAAPGKPNCGKDDPRYATLVPILKKLQAGESIEPMQTSFKTYVNLNANVRKTLGDNIFISSPDCSEQHLFAGELTGKINVPFVDLWQVINDALRTNDPGLMNFVAKNARVTPESALSVISLAQPLHLDEDQTRKLYAVINPEKSKATDLTSPLLLDIFLAFGGNVQESDRGKTAFIDDYTAGLIKIYLERKGGEVRSNDIPGLDKRKIINKITSMLQTAGLRAEIAGSYAKERAEK